MPKQPWKARFSDFEIKTTIKISYHMHFNPGVHLIVTIAEKSVSDHSDQMDTPLLTIPTIIMILEIAIAGIGSGSVPAIVTIVNDQNNHMDIVQQLWMIRTIVIFPKVHFSSGSFHADFDFALKSKILEVFWTFRTTEWTWLGDRKDWLLLGNHSDRYDRNDQMDNRL